jgi:hypothetical protein
MTGKGLGRSEADLSVAQGHVAVRAPWLEHSYRRASSPQDRHSSANQRVKGRPALLDEVKKLFTTIPAPLMASPRRC